MKTKGGSGRGKRSKSKSMKKLLTAATLLGITLGANVGNLQAHPIIGEINFYKLDVPDIIEYSSIKIIPPEFNFYKLNPTDPITYKELGSNTAFFSQINLPIQQVSLSFDINVLNYQTGDALSVYWGDNLLQTLLLSSLDVNQWYAVQGINLNSFAGSQDDLTFILNSQSTASSVQIGSVMINQAPVPVPSTLLLLGAGFASLAGLRKKIKK